MMWPRWTFWVLLVCTVLSLTFAVQGYDHGGWEVAAAVIFAHWGGVLMMVEKNQLNPFTLEK